MYKVEFSPEQHIAFQQSLQTEKKHSARVISMLGAGLFICLTLINYFALATTAFSQLLPITLATLAALAIFYSLTYRECFLKHYNLIGTSTFLAVGLAL